MEFESILFHWGVSALEEVEHHGPGRVTEDHPCCAFRKINLAVVCGMESGAGYIGEQEKTG